MYPVLSKGGNNLFEKTPKPVFPFVQKCSYDCVQTKAQSVCAKVRLFCWLWTILNQSLPFRLLGAFRRPLGEHINLKELESYLIVEEGLGSTRWEQSRPISCLDSQVCLGCLIKGRSSSCSLNLRLQSAVPALLLFGVEPYYAFVASEDNCADDPTRLQPLRGPKREKNFGSLRRTEAEAGSFALLDSFPEEHGLDPLQMQSLLDLERSFERRHEPDSGSQRVLLKLGSVKPPLPQLNSIVGCLKQFFRRVVLAERPWPSLPSRCPTLCNASSHSVPTASSCGLTERGIDPGRGRLGPATCAFSPAIAA